MSRQSKKEYIAVRMRRYEGATPGMKSRIIDEVADTLGFSRKYVINLLNGRIRYRARKGRGRTYSEEAARVLADVWREAGCPCAPYFKAQIGYWVDEYGQYVANIDPKARAEILAMSDTTMGRLLKGLERVKPGHTRANRRSGRNNPLKEAIPCHSGEEVMACLVPPGDIQIDTFALGGGDPSDNFFWILDATDRRTQWTELGPTWNRGQHTTLEALKRIERRFPFRIISLHGDNGGEIINHHIAAFLGKERPGIYLSRSRPRRCNDNAHVEEKNRSVGRALFGERRIDCIDLQDDITRLCGEYSDFTNFFCPHKMLVAKTKRADGKGFTCRYDRPKTACQRVLDDPAVPEAVKETLRNKRDTLHGIELLHRIRKRLRRILRRQEEWTQEKHVRKGILEGTLPGSTLRVAPSGTPVQRPLQTGAVSLLPPPPSKRKQRLMSTQYLTNRKRPDYLSGTLSI